MTRRRGRKITFRAALFVLTISGALPMTADHAHAQGLFDLLGKIFGGWVSPPPANEKSGGPAVAYCVRLCDGHYFPMAKDAGTPHSSPEKVCSALCPASATKIYIGSGIDQASAADGTSYSKLGNAFAYRERMVPDCTCTGKEAAGTAAIDIQSDPTLRAGDIVVTKDGLMVFKGSKKVPYQTGDFVPADEYKGLPAGVRKTLAELKVAPELNNPVVDITTVSASGPKLPPQSSGAPSPRDTPVAEAYPFISFPILQ